MRERFAKWFTFGVSFSRSSFTNAQIEEKTWFDCVLTVLVGDFFSNEALDFNRLVILLHFPPSLVDRAKPLVKSSVGSLLMHEQETFWAMNSAAL